MGERRIENRGAIEKGGASIVEELDSGSRSCIALFIQTVNLPLNKNHF